MAAPEKLEAFLAERRNVVVAGIRPDGRPHLTPNWFHFDGERFYVSTMKNRAKYRIFKRDPRAELLIDDSTGFRAVVVDGTAELWEDLDRALPYIRTIREKYGRPTQDDAELRADLEAENRFLLVIVPDGPPSSWASWGLD
ncbi:MAG TPA: PPOX class F420-dependent oxidoreductase [Acidimicrobiales bacterium]|nr:PPOX class F420-dependent oxidoreductase [Acidimicrobiales bacterium]